MPEKLYAILLKLYPEHFRRTYGDEALRLVRDRARDEKRFLSALRLWLDLLADLLISLPREYSNAPATAIAAAQPVSGAPSFQVLDRRSLNPALLFLSGMLSAMLIWACVSAVAHSRTFPALFPDSLSLQALVQRDLALARSPSAREFDAVCPGTVFRATAQRDIPNEPPQERRRADDAPISASDDLQNCPPK